MDRFFHAEEAMARQGWGIATMVVSSAVTLWLVRNLRRAATDTGSPALAADSKHYTTDVMMNVAVIIGLALSWLLDGLRWPDLAVGLGIALVILNTARELFLLSLEGLMDRSLKPREAASILHTVARFAPRVAGFHDLRSRRSGADVFLEVHLDLDRGLSFVEAHDLAEEVSDALETAIPNCQVTVHADPL
jgi:ferrous-iron efflux pump FieF